VACASANSPGSVPGQPATIVRYEPNAVEVDANSATGGLLVLTDSYDSEWSVTVDNAPAVLVRTDTALRGVCLPAGTHHISFVYQPRAFWAGVAISLAAWLFVGLVGSIIGIQAILTLRKRRKAIVARRD